MLLRTTMVNGDPQSPITFKSSDQLVFILASMDVY